MVGIDDSSSNARRQAWEQFCRDEQLQRTYNVKPHELESLKRAALFGDLRCKEDFIFMLKAIRVRSR